MMMIMMMIVKMPMIIMTIFTKECPRHQVTVGGGLPPASQVRVSDSPG